MTIDDGLYNYDDLNHTELIALALRDGLLGGFHRGVTRDDLINMLEGHLDPEEMPADPINEDRNAMLMMQEQYPAVQRQLYCEVVPSYQDKEGNLVTPLRMCWECPPARAVACARENVDPILMDQVRKGKHRGEW